MKRLHVSFNVADLAKSVQFYENLFAQSPSVVKHDYAKWLLDDPRMNFVLEARGAAPGFGHAAIQVDEQSELQPVFEQMKQAEAPYLPEGVTSCCYAKSEKSWTADTDGVLWEAFYTFHQSEHRGVSNADPEQLKAQDSGCC
jgi:catechol 2,3-dioxygenase-like lactoylglutathione lyase family enzyme